MAYKHGVYTSELPTSLIAPIDGTAGLQVIIGTAPVNLAKNPAAAVNTPILCHSYAEAVEKVGFSNEFDKYTLCQSIMACFKVFNVSPIVLINVLDPDNTAHTESVTDESVSNLCKEVRMWQETRNWSLQSKSAARSAKALEPASTRQAVSWKN